MPFGRPHERTTRIRDLHPTDIDFATGEMRVARNWTHGELVTPKS